MKGQRKHVEKQNKKPVSPAYNNIFCMLSFNVCTDKIPTQNKYAFIFISGGIPKWELGTDSGY